MLVLGIFLLIVLAIFDLCRCSQTSYIMKKHNLVEGTSLLAVSYSSLTPLMLGDNEVTSVRLPWGGFPFFENVYETGYISSNGLFSFADPVSSTTASVVEGIRPTQANKMKTDESFHEEESETFIVVLHRHVKRKGLRALSQKVRVRHDDRRYPSFSAHIHKELHHLKMIAIRNPSKEALEYLLRDPDVLSVEPDVEVNVEPNEYGNEGRKGSYSDFINHQGDGIGEDKPNFASRETMSSRRLKSDPYTWGLDRIDQTDLPLDEATYVPPAYTHKGANVDVYIVDSGLMTSHIEFGSVAGYEREVKNLWDAYVPDHTRPDVDNDRVGENF